MVTVDQWLAALRSYVGVKYMHQGRTRAGIDCAGLIAAAGNDLGLNAAAIRVTAYAHVPDAALLRSELAKHLTQRPYNRLQRFQDQVCIGDVLSFWAERKGYPRHLAVYTGSPDMQPTFIHAYAKQPRMVVEAAFDLGYWLQRVDGVYHVPELRNNMASMLLGSMGSSLLGPIGGFIGSQIGGMIDNAILGALSEPQYGPRIDDLTAIRGEPGTPIPLVYGADRIPGIVIASSDLIETVNKERVGSFLGLGGQKVITYTYHVDIDYMVSEGPILGIARIWAEGNPLRSTWYAMNNETALYPENIGGMNYPDYYKSHLYQPSLTPWSIIRSTSNSDDGKFYKSTSNRLAMIEITAAEASSLLLNSKQVVYWLDTDTGYYIPMHTDNHAYTGKKARQGEPPAPESSGVSIIQTAINNNEANQERTVIFDLLDPANNEGATAGYSLSQKMVGDASFGATNAEFQLRIEFYTEGTNELVDGNEVGSQIGASVLYQLNLRGEATVAVRNTSAEVPPTARYMVVRYLYVMLFPIWYNLLTLTADITLSRQGGVTTPDLRDWPDYWNLYDACNDWGPKSILQYSGSGNVTMYPGKRDQVPDPTMAAVQGEPVPAYINRAHIVFDRLELEDFGNRVPSMSFEVVQYDDVRIGAVISDLMSRSGLAASYYDVTSLPVLGIQSHVLGYSIATKTSFRAAMETMLEAFRIDAAEIGNSILFRSRDRGIDYTIPREELNAVEAGAEFGDTIKLQFRDQVEMPRKLSLRFKDVERNYQANTAAFSRQQGVANSDNMVELASVMPPSVAKRLARDKMRDLWLERTSSQFTVPHRYMYLAPSDIVLVDGSNVDKDDFAFKITTLTRGDNGIIEIEGVLRETTIYVPEAGEVDLVKTQNTFNHAGTTGNILSYTYLSLFDIPPLFEGDVEYSFYTGMGATSDSWQGANLMRSIYPDLGDVEPLPFYDTAVYATATDATLGVVVQSTLQDAEHEFIDYDSVVYVSLYNFNGFLQSITEDQLWRGENKAIIGKEVVQFLVAEKQPATGYWKLTGFLRGRRGTDTREILSGHQILDGFALVDDNGVVQVEDEPIYQDVEVSYKGVTFEDTIAETPSQNFTNTAQCLVPLSPVMLHAVHESNDDITITWARRDRAYTAWTNSVDLLNSEGIEQYQLELYSAQTDNPANLVRTATVNDIQQYIYTAAAQATDGLTLGEPLLFKVAQMSQTIGVGNQAKATI